MNSLISLPILLLLIIIPTSLANRLPVLQGVPDLLMLAILSWALIAKDKSPWIWGLLGAFLMGFMSEMPIIIYILAYLSIVMISVYIKNQIWKKSFLLMLTLTILGTLIVHVTSFIYLKLITTTYPYMDVINLITLPSILLNVLLAIPFFFILQDIHNLITPIEEV